MSIEEKNNQKENTHHNKLPDETIEEGMGNINSSSGEASENVISSSHSERVDKKHGRNNANPITGANPKGI